MTKGKNAEVKPPPWQGDAGGAGTSFGAWLRREREARGVALREIADTSRISMRYLEALEQDRFELLPAPVFARGFLREYARIVGLDGDEVVNAFLLAAGRAAAPAADEPKPRRGGPGAGPWAYGLLLLVAIAALLGLAVLLSMWADRRRPEQAPAVAFAPPTAARQEAPPTPRPEVEARASDSAAADSPRTEAEAPAATATPAAPLVVGLRFVDDCWVEATVDGRRRPGELRVTGESLVLAAQREVALTLGNRRGVAMTVNGRAHPLPAGSGNVVRGLRLTRASAGAP